jgi:hypothetical protein
MPRRPKAVRPRQTHYIAAKAVMSGEPYVGVGRERRRAPGGNSLRSRPRTEGSLGSSVLPRRRRLSERHARAALGQHRSRQRKVRRGRDDEQHLTVPPAQTIAHTIRQEIAALRDFQSRSVRFGSISTLLAEATGPIMSAMPPIATKAVPRSETSRCAKRRHCPLGRRDSRYGLPKGNSAKPTSSFIEPLLT